MAAAAVFERKGFAGATISDILDEASVTKGALYFHFDSKNALAAAIVEQQVDWREAHTPESRWAMQRIIDLSFRFVHALRSDLLVRASIRLTLERNTFRTDDPSPYVGWVSSVAQLFAEARDAGELSADVDPDAAAGVAVSALTGTQLLSEALNGREDVFERVESLWQLLLPGLVPARVRNKLVVAPPAFASS
jgi:AcrR family transcriptional regulator